MASPEAHPVHVEEHMATYARLPARYTRGPKGDMQVTQYGGAVPVDSDLQREVVDLELHETHRNTVPENE